MIHINQLVESFRVEIKIQLWMRNEKKQVEEQSKPFTIREPKIKTAVKSFQSLNGPCPVPRGWLWNCPRRSFRSGPWSRRRSWSRRCAPDETDPTFQLQSIKINVKKHTPVAGRESSNWIDETPLSFQFPPDLSVDQTSFPSRTETFLYVSATYHFMRWAKQQSQAHQVMSLHEKNDPQVCTGKHLATESLNIF